MLMLMKNSALGPAPRAHGAHMVRVCVLPRAHMPKSVSVVGGDVGSAASDPSLSRPQPALPHPRTLPRTPPPPRQRQTCMRAAA